MSDQVIPSNSNQTLGNQTIIQQHHSAEQQHSHDKQEEPCHHATLLTSCVCMPASLLQLRTIASTAFAQGLPASLAPPPYAVAPFMAIDAGCCH
jgi:hypothetical protein